MSYIERRKEITDEIETEASLTYYNWQQLLWKVIALQKRIKRIEKERDAR